MPTTRFFADLPAADNFADLFDPARYTPVPEDWILVISDVEGSTLAVKAGKYRAVNLVGAACIIAVVNIAEGLPLPYVFGGDGALVAVPPGLLEKAKAALLGVALLSQQQYELKLRVGAVPVAELRAGGYSVSVARYRLAGDETLAMFWGDGLVQAENWVKAPGSRHQWTGEGTADLAGLSCRWEPFRPESGKIMALLVKSRTAEETTVYRRVFEEVNRLAGEGVNPVKLEKLKKDRMFPSTLDLEQRLSAQRSWLGRLWARGLGIFEIVMGNFMFHFGLKAPTFDAPTYLATTVQRSDFRKFDGMLRMVIEVPDQARPGIEAFLEDLKEKGEIFYGMHWSEDAIMTCAIFSRAENRHLHFIDGGDGGYAFAAVGLKKQMAEAAKAGR